MTDTLVYLAQGPQIYAQEAKYSMLSALGKLAGKNPSFRFAVYTDIPSEFRKFDIDIIKIDTKLKKKWLNGDDYAPRIKMCVFKDALERYGGKVAFVDTDTYFRKSPELIFDRIGPGRSVLHVPEGTLAELTGHRDSLRFLEKQKLADLDGRPVRITKSEIMWNSGVAGIHSSDISALKNAIHLVDQVRKDPLGQTIFTIEQLFMGVEFSKITCIMESIDVVYHYWLSNLKEEFRTYIPTSLQSMDELSLNDWLKITEADRPTSKISRRIVLSVRTRLRQIGLSVPGARASG